MVLIDSSVWIEVSRKDGDLSLKEEVATLLREGQSAMTWPIWVELYQGSKGMRDEENLRGWREVSHWLDFDDACWTVAAACSRACLRAGINVPFGDILIHACATRHQVQLLEQDRHFAMIRKALAK
ncbi:MAG: PIN domain-containing protein [Luteolibacter sp.]|jgi:predicted nucleic acid-binding protein